MARIRFTFCCAALLALVLPHGPLLASSSQALQDAERQADEMSRLIGEKIAQINAQHRELLQRMAAVEQQRRELELLMTRVVDLDEYRAGSGVDTVTPEVGQTQKSEFEAQQEAVPELPRVSADIGGVLSPKGRLTLEPSIQFVQNSVNRVSLEGLGILPALAIGSIDIRGVDRETFVTALTARFGITNRLEAELKGSYVMRDDSTRTRDILRQTNAEDVFNASGRDFGDVEFGLRYQFRKREGWPFVVGNLRVKSATGTDPFEISSKKSLEGESDFTGELATGSGFWSVSPSFTFIYPTDPVAFFGNIGYLWTVEDNKGTFLTVDSQGREVISGFGRVDPGDAWRFNFGAGIGLNDQSSLSFSYSLDKFSETTIENAQPQNVIGSDVTVGKFVVGYSVRLPGGAPFNLAVGIGTTDAAADTDVTLRIPFTVTD